MLSVRILMTMLGHCWYTFEYMSSKFDIQDVKLAMLHQFLNAENVFDNKNHGQLVDN